MSAEPTRDDVRLQQALERVYDVFASRPPSVIEGCPCCIDTRNVDELLSIPLRQLTGEALWRYVSGAFLTVGGERDFKYLLPRILDISINDPGNANGPEIELGKLKLANWRSWPAEQQDAVVELIDAWFERDLAADLTDSLLQYPDWPEGVSAYRTESLLCGATRAGISPARWVGRLRDPNAAPVLIDLRRRLKGKASGFWEDVPEEFSEFGALLK